MHRHTFNVNTNKKVAAEALPFFVQLPELVVGRGDTYVD
jgi:hypothetical protein